MSKRFALPVALAALLALVSLTWSLFTVGAQAAQASVRPTATLDLDDSLPGDGMTVEGVARIKGFPSSRNLLVELRVTGLKPNAVHAWHIHLGSCENQGPVAINPGRFKDLRANSQGVAFVSVVLPDTPPGGGSILTNGAPYYINVHERGSTDPNGIGGGITCGDFSTNPPALATILTGAEEVSQTGQLGVGDPDGSGMARIEAQVGLNRVCYELSVSGIATASAAHIHKQVAGKNGPIVVHLAAPATGSSAGCATGLDAALVADINANPQNYYVNVHNAEFPGGALRGQLGD